MSNQKLGTTNIPSLQSDPRKLRGTNIMRNAEDAAVPLLRTEEQVASTKPLIKKGRFWRKLNSLVTAADQRET